LTSGAEKECSSHGTLFTRNKIKYFKDRNWYKPTIDLKRYPSNVGYCESSQFFADTGLDQRLKKNDYRKNGRISFKNNKRMNGANIPNY
jgi:hypothetical protein